MAKATGEVITIDGQVYQDRIDACEAMNALLERHLKPSVHETRCVPIGSYCGLKLMPEMRKDRHLEMIISGVSTHYPEFRAVAAGTLLNRIDNMIDTNSNELRHKA